MELWKKLGKIHCVKSVRIRVILVRISLFPRIWIEYGEILRSGTGSSINPFITEAVII